jgi:CYTH domain-containing protein
MPDIEKESTFLLNSIPKDLSDWKKEYTKDTYLPPDSGHPMIRLRKRGDKLFMTKKYPKVAGDFSTMIEETINLLDYEYTFLEENLSGNVLEKTRYSKQFEGYIIEIDEYLDDLAPLKVMDIEWDGEVQELDLSQFDIKKEITQQNSLAAGNLAGKKFSEIENLL